MRFIKKLLLVFLCVFPITLDASNASGQVGLSSEGIEITTSDGKQIRLDQMTDPQSLDYKILSYIFGTMGPSLACQGEGCSSLMGELFRLFNISLSTLAVLILGYVIVMSAFNSASSGQFFNQQFSSSILPLRSVLGISFLMPNAYGYSLLQQLVMSVVLLGSSFATIIWNNIQVYAEQYQGLGLTTGTSSNIVGQVTRVQASTAAQEIISTLTVVAGINYYADQETAVYFLPADAGEVTEDAVVITFSGDKATNDALYVKNLYSNIQRDFQLFIPDTTKMPEENLPLALVDSLNSTRDKFTNYFVQPGRIGAADQYNEKKTPWIFLPNDFFSFISLSPPEGGSQQKSFSVSSNLYTGQIITSLIGSSSEINSVYSQISKQFPLSQEESATKNDIVTQLSSLKEAAGLKSFFSTFSEVIEKLREGKEQPIQIFLDYGVDELNSFFNILTVIMGMSFIPLLITGAGYTEQGSSNIALGMSLAGVAFAFANLFLLQLPLVLTFVFTLPIIPLLAFVSSVISWFIQVVSSVIAAPIMALGMISPGQGFGRAAPAFVMLINLFLRPSLIVIGFLAALILFNTFCVFFTEFYLLAMNFFIDVESSFFNQGFIAGLVINWIIRMIFLYVYLFAIIGLITRCFNLVYTLPDNILVWIGGQPLPFGQDAQQSAQQVKQGIAQSASSAQQEGSKFSQNAMHALRAQQSSKSSVGAKYRASTHRMMKAAKDGNIAAFHRALGEGVDKNEIDGKKMTALMHAAQNGNQDIMQYLIQAKADLSAKDSEGKTAFDYAQEYQNAHPVLGIEDSIMTQLQSAVQRSQGPVVDGGNSVGRPDADAAQVEEAEEAAQEEEQENPNSGDNGDNRSGDN